MEQEEIDRLCNVARYEGRIEALERLERAFKHQAGQAFTDGKDIEAKLLRELSIEVGKQALEERKHLKDLQPKLSFGL